MLACLLLCVSTQTPAIDDAVKQKLETLRYIESLRDPASRVYKVTAEGKPNLRAINGAVKAIKLLGGQVTDGQKLQEFVIRCYEPTTGAFAEEPGGHVTLTATSVGIITAVGIGLPKDRFRKALDHLKAKATVWEDVRLAGAAVEAWGVKDCPIDLTGWDAIADQAGESAVGGPREGGARDVGGVVAFKLRLGRELPAKEAVAGFLKTGQRQDGGWAKPGADESDLESSYRVMRALHLLKAKPEASALRAFLASCRKPDGGYSVTPKGPASMSGVYYATMIESWLR